MITNEKPSAIFKVSQTRDTDIGMDDTSISADVGISIEPIDQVIATVALGMNQNQGDSVGQIGKNGELVLAGTGVGNSPSSSVAIVATKVLENLFNHLSSFAASQLPPDATLLQLMESPLGQTTYIPLKVRFAIPPVDKISFCYLHRRWRIGIPDSRPEF